MGGGTRVRNDKLRAEGVDLNGRLLRAIDGVAIAQEGEVGVGDVEVAQHEVPRLGQGRTPLRHDEAAPVRACKRELRTQQAPNVRQLGRSPASLNSVVCRFYL